MVRIRIKLALKLGQRLFYDGVPVHVRVAEVIRNPVDPIVLRRQRAQHVVKRAVLHHQHDNVLEVIQSGWRHSLPTSVKVMCDSIRVVTLIPSAFQ